MGFLKNVANITEVKELTRWHTVLDADDFVGEPACDFELGLVNDDKLLRLSKPFQKRGGNIELAAGETKKFRKLFLAEAVKNWRGMTKGNVRRMCEYYLKYPEVLNSVPEGEWVFNPDDLQVLGEHMNVNIFNDILSASVNMEEFVRDVLEREKKEQTSS